MDSRSETPSQVCSSGLDKRRIDAAVAVQKELLLVRELGSETDQLLTRSSHGQDGTGNALQEVTGAPPCGSWRRDPRQGHCQRRSDSRSSPASRRPRITGDAERLR